jgi:diacylglycerol kinase
MPDDGTYKGHGAKPGRQSKVVSMSAHKSRHSGDSGLGKKLSSLTLFDFSPAEVGDDYSADEAAGSNALVCEVSFDDVDINDQLQVQALPCENTPFERNADIGASVSEPASNADLGRKSLRWGLEPRDAEAGPESRKEKSRRERSRREEWQHKTGSTGSLLESFYHALNGLYTAFDTERNVRIHCCIAATVLVMALALKVDANGCLALILVTAFVLFAEYINTAIEHVTDIQANFRHHPSAKLAKDTAAGAVVIAAVTAVMVGAIVFIPRLWAFACGTL